MFTTDAHCDTLYEIAIKGTAPEKCVVTPERLKEGNVCLQTFAMYTSMRRPDPKADGVAMMAAYRVLPVDHMDGELPAEPPKTLHSVLSIEGGELLGGDLETLRKIDDEARVRLIALTWNFENGIGVPAKKGPEGGLTPFGRELVAEMDRRGICVDVSHLNEGGFWEVVENAKVPPVASHSDCRWLCDVPRNLRKEQVKALIDRGGFIGINFYSDFLADGRPAVMDDVYRHIDEVMELGGEDIIGFGSDFDGIDVWPDGIGDPRDFPSLLEHLRERGYSQTVLEKLAGLNYWRVLKTAEAIRG